MRKFKKGYNNLVSWDLKLGFDFGIRVMEKGDKHNEKTGFETCAVLLIGALEIKNGDKRIRVKRKNVFEDDPVTLLLPADSKYEIRALSNVEIAEIRTRNNKRYEPRIFLKKDVRKEHRGKGMLDDTCYRIVKTVFDYSNMSESNLVVGEVINFPGKWSSYPPHHHEQPELYFYKFLPEQGFGLSQTDEKGKPRIIRNNDWIKIFGKDHSQVAAPGYVMWYLWVVRHLPRKPYKGFEFAKEHEWVLSKEGEKKYREIIKKLKC